jgi:hypothetical protein
MSLEQNKEYIVCSAVWFKDDHYYSGQPKGIIEGIVVCGYRHNNCYETYAAILKVPVKECIYPSREEGFLTNMNRFVNRSKAGEIAFTAEQTETLIMPLISEYLYK